MEGESDCARREKSGLKASGGPKTIKKKGCLRLAKITQRKKVIRFS